MFKNHTVWITKNVTSHKDGREVKNFAMTTRSHSKKNTKIEIFDQKLQVKQTRYKIIFYHGQPIKKYPVINH